MLSKQRDISNVFFNKVYFLGLNFFTGRLHGYLVSYTVIGKRANVIGVAAK